MLANGQPTGSVLKETIAVSSSISISVQKQHSKILLRAPYAAEWENASRTRSPRGKKSQWKNGSIAVQGLPQRNLHQLILWKMASSRVLVLQVRKWMQVWWKVLLCASPGWWTAEQNILKKMVIKVQRRSWKLHDNWVAYFLLWSRRRLHRFCARAQHTETNPMCSIHWSRGASC